MVNNKDGSLLIVVEHEFIKKYTTESEDRK